MMYFLHCSIITTVLFYNLKHMDDFVDVVFLFIRLVKLVCELANDLMVQFGQTICRPIGPQCDKCPLTDLCEYDVSKLE